MAKGQISVQTENIFPIIKQFLYSDQEIFLRELVSNAVDASSKLKTLSSKGVYKGELGDMTIDIILEEDKLIIKDRGIGMSEEQTKKIFQPYYRAEQSGKTSRKGYGVGLTIVNRLSNRFNWIVEVESEVDVGTRIEVFFDESKQVKTTDGKLDKPSSI